MDPLDIEEENDVEKPKHDKIDRSLAFKGQWMVSVYDLGEFCVSQNLCTQRTSTVVSPHNTKCLYNILMYNMSGTGCVAICALMGFLEVCDN